MMFVKFTRKAIFLIYNLFLFNAVFLGPAYCMDMYPEGESTLQKLRSSFKSVAASCKKRTEVWQAKKNGEALRFAGEDGKVVRFMNFIGPEELEEDRDVENIPTISHLSSLTINVEAITEREEDDFLIINQRRISITLFPNATL